MQFDSTDRTMAYSKLGSINLKPNKAESFKGKKDFLTVNTWLFHVQQYLSLTFFSNPYAIILVETRVMFVSFFIISTASS